MMQNNVTMHQNRARSRG